MDYTPIGRVRPIHRGTHDPSAAYEALDVVRRADGLASYMAKQAVPAGETLADGEYWGLLSDAGVKAVADAACVPFAAGGSVAECHPVAGYPLEVRSDIGPVQSGSGDPSPDNVRPITGRTGAKLTRCGKNLINDTNLRGIVLASKHDMDNPFKAVGTYTLSIHITGGTEQGITLSLMSGTSNIKQYSVQNGTPAVIEITNDILQQIDNCKIYTWSGSVGATLDWIMLNQGSTAATYEPYTGDTYAADFGQTVYGGTLDWTTGELTVEWKTLIFDGTENWQGSGVFMVGNDDRLPSMGTGNVICSHYAETRATYWDGMSDLEIGADGWLIGIKDMRYSNADDFKSYLAAQYAAGTPVQVVYRLATPTTIQLTPQEVAALEGVNTLYSSTGDTAVAGRADMGWVTQSIMDRLAALESAALSE